MIAIAGRHWPAGSTFRTGEDAFGWDQCQARTFAARCLHAALTALAQLTAIAAVSALAGAVTLPEATEPAQAGHPVPESVSVHSQGIRIIGS